MKATSHITWTRYSAVSPETQCYTLVSSPLRTAPAASGNPWLGTAVLTHATPSTSAEATVRLGTAETPCLPVRLEEKSPSLNVGEQRCLRELLPAKTVQTSFASL